MSNFDIYVERVLKHEGGYVNHPNDPGGETKYGITWPTLRRGIHDGIVPPEMTIKNLELSHATALYHEYYYKPWLWIESDALRFQVFDAYVNHSPSSVIRMLQRAVGAYPDGVVGTLTKAHVQSRMHSPEKVVLAFLANRQSHFVRQGTWDSFGQGWMVRMAENMLYAAEDL